MFHVEFDKALWLILEADMENRQVIIDLLRAIPEDFLNEIKDKLRVSGNNYSADGRRNLENGIVLDYCINIDSDEASITLGSKVSSSVSEEDTINMGQELTLVWERDMGLMSDYWLGTFSYICDIDTNKHMNSDVLQGFVLTLDRSSDSLKIRGCIREVETEYNLMLTESDVCVEIKTAKERKLVPVLINEMPTLLTREYINNRYGDNPSRTRII